MILCRTVGSAVIVPVRVQPGASRDGVAGEYNGSLKVAVTQPAERGRANRAAAAVLAKALGVRESAVTLLSGETSRNKVFRIEGASAERVSRLA